MKTAAALKQPLALADIAEATQYGVQLCNDSKNLPSEVITVELAKRLPGDVLYEMARVGWIRQINDEFHQMRQIGKPDAEGTARRPASHPISGRNPRGAGIASLARLLYGADNKLKQLAEFTLADVRFLRKDSENQRDSFARRAAWAVRAEELLTANKKAQTVKDLNSSQVEELSKLADGVWQ